MDVIFGTDAWIAMLELLTVGGGAAATGLYFERKGRR